MHRCLYNLFPIAVMTAATDLPQTQFSISDSLGWRVELSQNWDVLGPFPIQAREQQFLSPSFPLDLTRPIDYTKLWPSSYADGGEVAWSKARSDHNGWLKISFPQIRWKSLRANEGWASLQHHALGYAVPPRLLVDVIQGSYFTILPEQSELEMREHVPQWHTGNVYDMERALPRAVTLPIPPSTIQPTSYDLFLSGDYEIRLFGDPKVKGSNTPVQNIRVTLKLEEPSHTIVREPSQDIICDFVDGFAFGDAIGLGLRSVSGWWNVIDIKSRIQHEGFTLHLMNPTRIISSQTRAISISIVQTSVFKGHAINIDLVLISETSSESRVISVEIPVRHINAWNPPTYFSGGSTPSLFVTIPPELAPKKSYPPILCLHGAGVDLQGQQFFVESLPASPHSWYVVPTGQTSWGLDWHGPSARDAWASVDALAAILEKRDIWDSWGIRRMSPVIIMGHSNGGQGAWYIASRFPDRVLGVIPAAGYIKSQAYVPLTMSRSAHFMDPSLRAILETSLTPDDNDLFLSNLADIPVLAIHGGDDDNVPVWHSRESVGIIRTWRSNADVALREVPGEGHWYPSVFNNEQVRAFLERVVTTSADSPHRHKDEFTLTVAIPLESGSLHGWKIEELIVPGRLGRLRVNQMDDQRVRVTTSNVNRFSVQPPLYGLRSIQVDDSQISLPPQLDDPVHLVLVCSRSWQIETHQIPPPQPSSRIQAMLTSDGPIVFVVPDSDTSHELSVALRISHDLSLYHRLDSHIMRNSEALTQLSTGSLPSGNIVVLGNPSMSFIRKILARNETSFMCRNSHLILSQRRILQESGQAALFLHPHPSNTKGLILFMIYSDALSLERAAKLFPIRTGITVPDWVVIGSRADLVGAAGIEGAGVWGRDWNWDDTCSWLY
ncbi:hypothetical protein BD779DRAFT_1501027 [Infundibulicybe gibba]|nr:hypothetical protein BD779DRAFT_1501027 [Infundibulicybe gibba]